jgi:hypothetical protein
MKLNRRWAPVRQARRLIVTDEMHLMSGLAQPMAQLRRHDPAASERRVTHDADFHDSSTI